MKLTRGKIYKYLSIKNQSSKNYQSYILSPFSFSLLNVTKKKKQIFLQNKTLRNI